MIDYVSIQDKMFRNREGTPRPVQLHSFAYGLKYIN